MLKSGSTSLVQSDVCSTPAPSVSEHNCVRMDVDRLAGGGMMQESSDMTIVGDENWATFEAAIDPYPDEQGENGCSYGSYCHPVDGHREYTPAVMPNESRISCALRRPQSR